MKHVLRFANRHFFSAMIAAALSCFLVISPAVLSAEKSATNASTQEVTAPININRAKAEQLSVLVGVGMKKAEAIVAYRSKVGKFKSIEQLSEVKGIGAKTVEKNRHLITL